MHVRTADKAADRAEILAGARAFAEQAGLTDFLPQSPADFEQALLRVLSLDILTVFLAEHEGRIVGGMGLITTPYLWNPALTHADELFWWCYPDAPSTAALRLLKAANRWIAERGIDIRTMHAMETSPRGLDNVYRQMGLRLMQRTYARKG